MLDFLPKLPFRSPEHVFKDMRAQISGGPNSVMEVLRAGTTDEAKAIEDYKVGASIARAFGDPQTATLLDHIRQDETHHLSELNKRVREIMFGGKR